ncbi:MAG: thioredoxin family protein [Geminicoccaceae bacterium]
MRSRTIAALLAGIICTLSGVQADEPAAPVEPILTDDGLYTQEWFLESFLDLAEDLDEAKAAGKRFAIMWELKGCPYCEETHLVNLAAPEINAYVRDNFHILQLNFLGSRLVTDFDGEELEERALREKYGIRFTPTLQFFPKSSDEIGAETGQAAEIARMPGYFKPDHFIAMFRFVRNKAYDRLTFREYLQMPGSD